MSDQHTTVQYQLRLPEDLRDKVKESANTHNRSMNADIVARLQQSFSDSSNLTDIERSNYEKLKHDIYIMTNDLTALIRQVTDHNKENH